MRRLILLIAVSAFLPGLRAEVTLDECRRLAAGNYPLVRQYSLIEKSTEYSISNARRGYIPQVTLSAQATYQSAVANFPEDMRGLFSQMGLNYKGLNKDQYKAMVELQQTIWDGGASKSQREQAEAEGNTSGRNVEVEIYAVNDRVNQMFFGILMLKAQQEQNADLQKLLQSNCDRIGEMVDNGTAIGGDLDAVRAELLSTVQAGIQIKASDEAYRRMLSLLTGRVIGEDERFVRPQDEIVAQDSIKRPELQLIDAQIAELGAARSALKSSSNPKIGAFAQGFYGNPGLDMFKDMLENKWTPNYMVGIKLQWSLTPYYTRRNSMKKLDLSREQLGSSRETFIFNTNIQVAQLEGEIKKMREVMRRDDEIIMLRNSVRKTAESKFQNGIIYVSDLLREITNENDARIAKSLHEIELLKNIYDLKNTINK